MFPEVIKALYPPSCIGCGDRTDQDHALCGPCWPLTPFISGLVCDACGTGLPGEGDVADGLLCDECLTTARPWDQGRAALDYGGLGRRFILQLKHGDRTDLATPMSIWMANAARPIVTPDMLVIPVPLHRMRLFARRFNQAALLGRGVARALGLAHCPDGLVRTRFSQGLGKLSRQDRFAALTGAFELHPQRAKRIRGKDVLLVDDVMTTGATLAAATEALRAGGAGRVAVLTLARATKDP